MGDRGGDEGFADPGVGAGYEEAGFLRQSHFACFVIPGKSVLRVSYTISRSISSVGRSIAGAGIRTMTSPRGRRSAFFGRMARQTFAPISAAESKDALVFLSLTISMPAIRPHWRVLPMNFSFEISASFLRMRAILGGRDSMILFRSNNSREAMAAAQARALPV